MIGAEDRYQMLVKIINQIKILEYRVCRASVPRVVSGTHLSRYRNDELIFQETTELPAVTQMSEQRLALELDQHIDGVKARIDETAENEINDPVFAPERDGRLGALLGQWE